MSRRLLGGLGLILVVAGLAVYGSNGVVRVWHMQRELQALERELGTLRARTRELTDTVDRLRNDPLFIEKLAREDLGMVHPGETILKFPSPSPNR